jgi:cullin-associated NEDD8-dissociated protein 1
LGEIGRRRDLSANANIEVVVIGSFQSPSEEIKAAASYALGNIAVGNLAQYLPFILNEIDRQAKLQYLLLHSLKEVKPPVGSLSNCIRPREFMCF